MTPNARLAKRFALRTGEGLGSGPGCDRAHIRSRHPGPIPGRGLALTATLFAALAAAAPAQAQQADHPGKPVYDKWCAGCHGVDGQGQGDAAAWMLPRPRNFVQALYQIRSTRSGSLPTDADILHVIDVGMPGTAMPGWRESLSQQERDNLVSYLKTFSRFFESDQPQVLEMGGAPGGGAEVIEQGRQAYQQLECFKCHGQEGRGDGASAPTQEDDNKFPIRPADLSQPWLFNGGGTVEDIYRRLRTGLDGTPMPSLTDALEGGIVTEEQLWAISHYVRSLTPEDPALREVIEAKRIEGELPASADDSAWNSVDRFWIPLAGQIIVKPRWFSPAVTGVWVQALHNGTDLSMRVSWNDRSNSPDPVWAQWRARVTEVMEPKESVAADAAAAGPAEAAGAPESPDAIAIWFPRRIPSGMERPYFFMGNTRDPVYLWHWQSRGQAAEMRARGPGLMEPLAGAGSLTAHSTFDNGQWRVVFRRPIAAADSANAVTFTGGQPVPMAIFAWDGDNGEHGTRGALSTWYFVQLTEPAPASTYTTPLIATLLTAGLGVLVVGRAQRRERGRKNE
jgi:mono/diheme cytochrome c family protein